jgi:hypothetical protein
MPGVHTGRRLNMCFWSAQGLQGSQLYDRISSTRLLLTSPFPRAGYSQTQMPTIICNSLFFIGLKWCLQLSIFTRSVCVGRGSRRVALRAWRVTRQMTATMSRLPRSNTHTFLYTYFSHSALQSTFLFAGQACRSVAVWGQLFPSRTPPCGGAEYKSIYLSIYQFIDRHVLSAYRRLCWICCHSSEGS